MTFTVERSSPAHTDPRRLKRIALGVGAFVLSLWILRGIDVALDFPLRELGVYPGRWDGLLGLVFAPLIHGSWSHVFANTMPMLVLGTAAFYGYPRAAALAVAAIWLGSGLGVWLTGRESFHIGASGLTHGLMFFTFVIGILRRDRLSIALTMLVFFLYGSMVWGIFPREPGVSYESHLWGAVSGVLVAFVVKGLDPLPPRKRYSWEDEDDEEYLE